MIAMPPLLVLASLLFPGQEADQRARDFFDRIQFEPPAADSDETRKVAEILLRKDHWIGAYKTLERLLGSMPDLRTVTVDFTLEGADAGWGGSNAREGRVRFNLRMLGEIQKRIDDLEARNREAQGRRPQPLAFRVPPLRMDRLIYHELTHVFQRGCQAPGWFIEGMAQFVADDPNNIAAFVAGNKKVQGIDEGTLDRADAYARGHLFWKWLDSRGLVRKVADLVVLRQRPWKEALEEATGMPWALQSQAEREWSGKELDHLRPVEPKGR